MIYKDLHLMQFMVH